MAGDLKPEEENKDENERSNSNNGLDFIDVRREIAAELRNDEIIGEKIKLLKTSVSRRNRLGTPCSSAFLKTANGPTALEKL